MPRSAQHFRIRVLQDRLKTLEHNNRPQALQELRDILFALMTILIEENTDG